MSYSASNSVIDGIKKEISAIQDYLESASQESNLLKNSGNSLGKANSEISQQLNKLSQNKKKFQRDVKNSFDQILDFINLTNGGGSQSLKYIRKKLLEASVKIEPKVKEILSEETIKVLGCSQEQVYPAISKDDLELQPLPLLPESMGIYIPIQQIDFFQNLKNFQTILYCIC